MPCLSLSQQHSQVAPSAGNHSEGTLDMPVTALRAYRVAAHNSEVNALAHTLGKAGGSVQTERFIPELYMKRANGTWQEAVMDIAVSWPLAPTLRLLDITPFFTLSRRSVGSRRGSTACPCCKAPPVRQQRASSRHRSRRKDAARSHRDAPAPGCREPDRAQMASTQRPAPSCARPPETP